MRNPSGRPMREPNPGGVSPLVSPHRARSLPRGQAGCTLTLPYLPQSFNRTQHAHWTRVSAAKKGLQADLEIALMAARVPRPIPGGHVEATAVLVVPDRRRRDTGNYRTPTEKALGDALVNGAWLPDDVPAHYAFGALVFEHAPGERQTLIALTWQDRAA
jgi:hypothetical protein